MVLVLANGHGSTILVRFNNLVCSDYINVGCFSGVYTITVCADLDDFVLTVNASSNVTCANNILLVLLDFVSFFVRPKRNSCVFVTPVAINILFYQVMFV